MIKSRRMRGAGQVPLKGERRGVYGGFVGKSKRKRPLRKINYRRKNNIKCRLKE
jgi:hypothetical protein